MTLYAWINIFGNREMGIRFLSYLFFLVTIIAAYLMGKFLWNKKTGILVALISFVNFFFFYHHFGEEKIMYPLLFLTFVLFPYFFLKKNRLGFISNSISALYIPHFFIFIIFFEFLWQIIKSWRQSIKKILKNFSDFLTIGFLYLLWLYLLYYQTSLVSSRFWFTKPTLDISKETIQKLIASFDSEINHQLVWWLAIVKNWFYNQKNSLFLLSWFFIPLTLIFLISQFFQLIFFGLFILIAIPANLLLLVSLRRKFSFIFILIFIFLLASSNHHYFFNPPKKTFIELTDYIKSKASNSLNADAHHLWEPKYHKIMTLTHAPQLLPFYTGTALTEKGNLISQLSNKEKIGKIANANFQNVSFPNHKIEKTKKFDVFWSL